MWTKQLFDEGQRNSSSFINTNKLSLTQLLMVRRMYVLTHKHKDRYVNTQV